LVHFMVFGIFSPVLVFCTSKNLATLREKWERYQWHSWDVFRRKDPYQIQLVSHLTLALVAISRASGSQGCQIAYFLTKNPNLGKLWRSCNGRYWYILWPFGLFYSHGVLLWQLDIQY
jgi:hypothetical protein